MRAVRGHEVSIFCSAQLCRIWDKVVSITSQGCRDRSSGLVGESVRIYWAKLDWGRPEACLIPESLRKPPAWFDRRIAGRVGR